MARAGLDKNIIVRRTAQIANEIGVEKYIIRIYRQIHLKWWYAGCRYRRVEHTIN